MNSVAPIARIGRQRGNQTAARARREGQSPDALGGSAGFRDNAGFMSAGQREP
jgi:hypothetical protein